MATNYKSQYSPQITDLVNSIVNRQAFSYDHNTDPAYQALAKTYGRLGETAGKNTLADVSMNTGGLASSAAVTAAAQARGQFNQQLVDQIPGLMEAAYGRYKSEFDMKNSALDQLRGLDNTDYSRFADDRDFTRGVYESDRGYNRDVFESDRGYNRDVYESDRGFNYGVSRDKIADSQWRQEFALSKKKVSSSGSGGDGKLPDIKDVVGDDKSIEPYDPYPGTAVTDQYTNKKATALLGDPYKYKPAYTPEELYKAFRLK